MSWAYSQADLDWRKEYHAIKYFKLICNEIPGQNCAVVDFCTNAQNMIVGNEWEHSMNNVELKLTFEFQWVLTEFSPHLLWYAHTTHSWLRTVELNTLDMVTTNHGWSLSLPKLQLRPWITKNCTSWSVYTFPTHFLRKKYFLWT